MQAGDIVAAIDLGTSRTAYAYTVVGREHIWLGVPDSPDDDRNVSAHVLLGCPRRRPWVKLTDTAALRGLAERLVNVFHLLAACLSVSPDPSRPIHRRPSAPSTAGDLARGSFHLRGHLVLMFSPSPCLRQQQ